MLITAMRTAMPKVTAEGSRMRPVGDRRIDLDARSSARVHDDGVGLGERELLRRQAVGLENSWAEGSKGLSALVLQRNITTTSRLRASRMS